MMFMQLVSREIEVLSSFFPQGEPLTSAQIQKKCGYSHERVHATLKALERAKFVSSTPVGRTLLYSISDNEQACFASSYCALTRKTDFMKKYPQFTRALDEFVQRTQPVLLIIFGSFARGQPNKESDLDLLCVSEKEDLEQIAAEIHHRYGFKLAPVFISLEEFPKIKTENMVLWKSLRNEGIIWKGHERFYDAVHGRWDEDIR